jgi:hypothetical protein
MGKFQEPGNSKDFKVFHFFWKAGSVDVTSEGVSESNIQTKTVDMIRRGFSPSSWAASVGQVTTLSSWKDKDA